MDKTTNDGSQSIELPPTNENLGSLVIKQVNNQIIGRVYSKTHNHQNTQGIPSLLEHDGG